MKARAGFGRLAIMLLLAAAATMAAGPAAAQFMNPQIKAKGKVVWEASGSRDGIYMYNPQTGELQGIKFSP